MYVANAVSKPRGLYIYIRCTALFEISFMIPKLAALIRRNVAMIRKVNERGLTATPIGFERYSSVTCGK